MYFFLLLWYFHCSEFCKSSFHLSQARRQADWRADRRSQLGSNWAGNERKNNLAGGRTDELSLFPPTPMFIQERKERKKRILLEREEVKCPKQITFSTAILPATSNTKRNIEKAENIVWVSDDREDRLVIFGDLLIFFWYGDHTQKRIKKREERERLQQRRMRPKSLKPDRLPLLDPIRSELTTNHV